DEILNAAADGEALAPHALAHLRDCALCSTEVERLRRLHGRFATLPQSIAMRADLWPQVRTAIVARQRRRRAFIGAASLAAAAALLFAVVRTGPERDLTPGTAPVSAELAELREVVTPAVADAMAANLTIYDAALQELETHAAVESENADLRQRIDELRRKRAALIRIASNS
ncbi:MAG TPA: hypothetical protein VJ717_20745, partial [Gemmatimonadaceae bacterium]|nr:hypothetical protein [Gemmatimonadaceae bacterium]